MTIFDSSGIEAFVTENNPKYANRIIRQLKAYAKAQGFDSNYDPHKAAYGNMPSYATANPEIKQLYINGHFCYVFKFGIVTNGLGIIRHISFYNKDFISLNERSKLKNPDFTINADDIPCCPHDPSLPMKPEGTAKTKAGLLRYKFVCPMTKWVYDPDTQKAHRYCGCKNPCTSSSCGRMVYIQQDSDYRAYPGAIRGTAEWDNTYKIRTVVKRDIQHIKDNLCLAGRRTQNEKTLHADLILAGITQLITVVLAEKIHHREYIRSLKPLIA